MDTIDTVCSWVFNEGIHGGGWISYISNNLFSLYNVGKRCKDTDIFIYYFIPRCSLAFIKDTGISVSFLVHGVNQGYIGMLVPIMFSFEKSLKIWKCVHQMYFYALVFVSIDCLRGFHLFTFVFGEMIIMNLNL